MKYSVTLKQLRTEGACTSGYNKVVRMLQGKPFGDKDNAIETHIRFAHSEPISLIDIVNNNGVEDAVWCLRCIPDCDHDARLFAVWCARQVQHLMTDKRSLYALDVAERFANGKATEEELDAARAAAWSTAWDAAGDAAWAAARAAAGDAAWAAARAAAWAAARAAAGDAAWAAARAAAWSTALDAAWDAAWSTAWSTALDAAWDAAMAAQKSIFIDMCNGVAPWQFNPSESAA